MSRLEETIVAMASPRGGAARGIVRMSGPGVLPCLERVFSTDGPKKPSDVRRPTVLTGRLRLGALASPLPCDLFLWPDNRSYTGEPVAELHTLGCPPLLNSLVEELCSRGARLAEPGEFTLRAFLSGRIDLTQAEAVLGVIEAHDQRQLDVALEQLAGGLSRPLGELREALVELLGHLEAGFDFPEEDLPFITPEQLRRRLAETAEIIERLKQQVHARETSDEPPRVALAGLPNTGKSSLFNALITFTNMKGGTGCSSASAGPKPSDTRADEQPMPPEGKTAKAIVSRHAGTTRDYLTARLDLDGVECCLVDTAGVGDDAQSTGKSTDTSQIDREAQEVAQSQAGQAQVRILFIDSTRPPTAWEETQIAAHQAHKETANRGQQQLVVFTKVDIAESASSAVAVARDAIATSSVTGEGIAELRKRLKAVVSIAASAASAVVAPTALRCRQSIRLAADSLARASEIARSRTGQDTTGVVPGEELIAAELRVALDELGKVVGTVYTDDVLERIFSRFCIGK